MTIATKDQQMNDPTTKEIQAACGVIRHDYPLLPITRRLELEGECRQWLNALSTVYKIERKQESATKQQADTKYETRVTRLTVVPIGEPIYSEQSKSIEIVDDAGGEYVKVVQDAELDQSLLINADEWPEIKAAIDRMLLDCRPAK